VLLLWDLIETDSTADEKIENRAAILDRCIEKFSGNAYDIDYKISMLI
jgi:hypothetical protein